MKPYITSIVLLCCSNVCMTFVGHAHPKHLTQKPWIIAAAISGFIASLEYRLQVPANRIEHEVMSLAQLKIMQKIITLAVFVPFVTLTI